MKFLQISESLTRAGNICDDLKLKIFKQFYTIEIITKNDYVCFWSYSSCYFLDMKVGDVILKVMLIGLILSYNKGILMKNLYNRKRIYSWNIASINNSLTLYLV